MHAKIEWKSLKYLFSVSITPHCESFIQYSIYTPFNTLPSYSTYIPYILYPVLHSVLHPVFHQVLRSSLHICSTQCSIYAPSSASPNTSSSAPNVLHPVFYPVLHICFIQCSVQYNHISKKFSKDTRTERDACRRVRNLKFWCSIT